MVTVSPDASGAVKEISSSTRSITVCRRRAPMFSTELFTSTAMRGERVDGVVREDERHALGRHQRDRTA